MDIRNHLLAQTPVRKCTTGIKLIRHSYAVAEHSLGRGWVGQAVPCSGRAGTQPGQPGNWEGSQQGNREMTHHSHPNNKRVSQMGGRGGRAILETQKLPGHRNGRRNSRLVSNKGGARHLSRAQRCRNEMPPGRGDPPSLIPVPHATNFNHSLPGLHGLQRSEGRSVRIRLAPTRPAGREGGSREKKTIFLSMQTLLPGREFRCARFLGFCVGRLNSSWPAYINEDKKPPPPHPPLST